MEKSEKENTTWNFWHISKVGNLAIAAVVRIGRYSKYHLQRKRPHYFSHPPYGEFESCKNWP